MLPGQRIQLTTDGFGSYPPVVDALWRDNIDYAQMIKDYTDGNAHQTLTKTEGTKTTPAIAAGVEQYPWSLTQSASCWKTEPGERRSVSPGRG